MKKTSLKQCLIALGVSCLGLGLGTTARADYYSAVTNLNPVAYYRLSDAGPIPTADLATNLGSLGGMAHYYAPEAYNQPQHPAASLLACSTDPAVTLDSAQQNAVILPANSTNASIYETGSFTVEAWINPASIANTPSPMSHYWADSNRYGWYWQITAAGNLRMLLYSGSGVSNVGIPLNTNVLVVGQTYHIAAVVTPTTAVLYVNGMPSPVVTLAAPMGVPGRHLTVGCRSSALDSFFSGTVDEVAVYPSALTVGEIQTHYQTGTNTTPADYSALVMANHPKVYLRLDEPAYTKLAQDDLSLPVATNDVNPGTFDGHWQVGSETAVAGPRPPEFSGFAADNQAGRFIPFHKGIVVPVSPVNNGSYITMVAWVRREVTNYSTATPMDKLVACGQLMNVQALLTSDKPQGARQGSFTYYTTTLASGAAFAPFVLDRWEQWVYVSQPTPGDDGNTQWIYVNGVEEAHGNSTLNLNNNGNPFDIGGMDNTKPDGFSGSIDEVAVFTNSLSAAQILDLYKAALPIPIIQSYTRMPSDPVYDGNNVTNTVVATSPIPMSYQWRKDGNPINGETNTTLIIAGASAENNGTYDVLVSNDNGSSTSIPNVLNVQAQPAQVVTSPQPAVRFTGSSQTFSVTPAGTAPFTNWWYKDGNLVFGPTTANTYTIDPVALTDAGIYKVAVSNKLGGTVSSDAPLMVETPTNFTSLVRFHSPIAYWRLNETNGAIAYDYIDGLNGTRLGGATAGVGVPAYPGFPVTNTCYEFNGTNGWVQAGGNVELNTNTITMIAMVKRNGFQTNATRIAGGFGGDRVDLEVDENGQIGAWFGNIGGKTGLTGLNLTDQTWCFVALVVTNGVGTVYMDDGSYLQQGTSDAISSGNERNFPMNIGHDTSGGGYFNGQIDEVAVFRTALSPTEIQQLDEMIFVGPTPPVIVTPPASQVRNQGETVVFSVTAGGTPPYAYQWYHDANPITTATNVTYSFAADYSNAGNYWVQVSNQAGVTNSELASLSVLIPNPSYLNLTNGLVLHLRLNGDYQDSSGNGNHAGVPDINTYPLSAAPAFISPGVLGSNALECVSAVGGPYAYATLGAGYLHPDLDFGSDVSFSVAYWVKTTGSSVPALSSMMTSAASTGFSFDPYFNASVWTWHYTLIGATTFSAFGSSAINDGQWHQLVHTFDRTGNAVTYLDGVAVDSRAMPAGLGDIYPGGDINVGQDGSGIYDVAGQIQVEDIGVWRRALWPAEAAAIYEVGFNYQNTFDTTEPIVMSLAKEGGSLVIYWQDGVLEENTDLTNPAGWTPVTGATAPQYVVPIGGTNMFYRVNRP